MSRSRRKTARQVAARDHALAGAYRCTKRGTPVSIVHRADVASLARLAGTTAVDRRRAPLVTRPLAAENHDPVSRSYAPWFGATVIALFSDFFSR